MLLKLSTLLLRFQIFFICFKNVHNCLSSILMMDALKSMLYNSNFGVSSVLASVHCLFFSENGIFLILGMGSNFQLKLGHLKYCLSRLSLIWQYTSRERGEQLGIAEVQAPDSLPTDTRAWGNKDRSLHYCWTCSGVQLPTRPSLIITLVGEVRCSPNGLHWHCRGLTLLVLSSN